MSDIEGTLYNAEGSKIRSLKKSEVKDYSNTSEANLADDDRVKHHDFTYRIYPYTVEYETEVEYNGLFHLPTWYPVISENVAVQSSSMKVIADADYLLRYKAFNYDKEPAIVALQKQKEYNWSVSKLPAIKEEAYSPGWHELTPVVFVAPSSFELQRYSGNMNTWKDFGTFMYTLNAGRNQLTPAIKQKVHELTDGIAAPAKKAELLYNFLQRNTRYISIQLGIGGWQTMDANFVSTNGYGDCKALSNYMSALLKEANVPSHTALIRAGSGEDDIIEDFSSNQFNHVIVCVPLSKDSLWLECTNQNTAPGYMGSFTGNRQALLITENGGVLVNTPTYLAYDNKQVRKIKAVLSAEGELSADVVNQYSGMQQDRLYSVIKQYSNTQLTEYMRTKFDLSSYQLEEFSHQLKAGKAPLIEETVALKVPGYSSVTDKRLFINPNVLSVSSFKLKDAANRKFDLRFKSGFVDMDTVEIDIPAGYLPESIPPEVNLKAASSVYKSSIILKPGKILYTRYYRQEACRVPAAGTKEIADFFEKIYKADHARIVFVKEGS